MLPVLLTLTFPPPDWAIPVMVNGSAAFTSEISPLVVFVALKLCTVLVPFSVVPPAELVVSSAALIAPRARFGDGAVGEQPDVGSAGVDRAD